MVRALKKRIKAKDAKASKNEESARLREKQAREQGELDEPTEEEIREMEVMNELDDVLENYDYLVSRLYTDPSTKQLYEIIGTRYNRQKGTIVSVAMPVDDSSHIISEPRMVQEREVIRADGTGTGDERRI